MKKRNLLLPSIVILFFTAVFCIHELGSTGLLPWRSLNQWVFPPARRFAGVVTDMKFRLRGRTTPRNRVVLVSIDSPSLERYGRWPWSRDLIASLVESIYRYGARSVVLDIVFADRDERFPPQVKDILNVNNMGFVIEQFDTDQDLARTLEKHAKSTVLSWMTESSCQPLFDGKEECPVDEAELLALLPQGFDKFGIGKRVSKGAFDATRTALSTAPTVISNHQMFSSKTLYQGFANSLRDPDGLIRRSSLVMLVGGVPHPSSALELARVSLGEELEIGFDNLNRIETLGFVKSGRRLPVTGSGIVQINFRGPEGTFPSISASEILPGTLAPAEPDRQLSSDSIAELLKDSVVLVGVTALGAYDNTATPFDNVIPGTEVLATIVDNILSGDFLVSQTRFGLSIITLLCLMTMGGALFVLLGQRLGAVPFIALVVATVGVMLVIDVAVLFEASHNWNTGFLYAELLTIAALTIAAKYISEEREKKYLRTAFAKYVSPQVVDEIVKDPKKLHLGGQKADLSVLFSDIRGFTTFSETMDAKLLSEFLNEYFSLMTDIIFRFDGTLDKYIGDALMAFFGAPKSDPAHASKACEAARAMLRTLSQNRERFREKYGIDVNIGVGVNSGIVSVGNMGSNQSFGYTVIGDNVNLASRLEGVTKKYGVHILTTHLTTEEIAAAELPLPPSRVVDIVKVKGKADAVQLIQILENECHPDGLLLFEEGREAYRARQWDEAIRKFREASPLLSAVEGEPDGPCEVFIERCEEMKHQPPAPDWDGSWHLDSK